MSLLFPWEAWPGRSLKWISPPLPGLLCRGRKSLGCDPVPCKCPAAVTAPWRHGQLNGQLWFSPVVCVVKCLERTTYCGIKSFQEREAPKCSSPRTLEGLGKGEDEDEEPPALAVHGCPQAQPGMFRDTSEPSQMLFSSGHLDCTRGLFCPLSGFAQWH